MKFIGIDSAALSGWAYVASDGEGQGATNSWRHGVTRADSLHKYDILKEAKAAGVTHACIEKPMPFKGSASHTFGGMSSCYGRWVEACEREGIVVVPAYVSQWQAAMLVINGKKVSAKAAGDDKYGAKLVASYWGAHCESGDAADAVCLCVYGPTAFQRLRDGEELKRLEANAKARQRRVAKSKQGRKKAA